MMEIKSDTTLVRDSEDYSNSTKIKCPTCGCNSVFNINGSLSDFLQKSNYEFRCYGNYSFSQEIIKVQKCPTCGRLRLFTPDGPLSHSKFLTIKKKVEKIISEYK